MSNDTNPWGERTTLGGRVDFTMMYAIHDAFTRDLERLALACVRGTGGTPGGLTGWTTFTRQLHHHHTVEDDALWPRLREKVSRLDEVAVLDDMELEHEQLAPSLKRVDETLRAKHAADLDESIHDLVSGLGAHMRHEENEALPLVETRLGPEGWAAFGNHIRKTQGLRGAAEFFPWLLDGAPEATQAKVLGMLPPPIRLLYRKRWAPKYHRIPRWPTA